MTPERWRQVSEVFYAAQSRDRAARAPYLEQACAGDRALRAEVDALLAAHLGPGEFFDRPVSGSIDVRRLETGAMVGPYRIDRLIGAGGMGEVYRARDTTLGRDVAIKVLPDAFTADPERLRRFEREARVLAALNHPHIAAIHGLEQADPSPGSGQAAVRALVLELVEGPTLADRVARGPLPVADALPIAQQIADALEAAHEKGIIHRDLKPANIKVTSDGVVKVLDFGLAKASTGDASMPDLSQSPSVTLDGTRTGMILGTAAYMSPEQARGQPVDKRTDIWAFGCVLYEMLTSRRAFSGDDVSDTLVEILRGDPDWSALPASTPAAVRKLLRGCLQKDRRERLPDIGVARLEIKETLTAPLTEAVALVPVPRLRVWQRPAPLAAGIVTLIAAAGLTSWFLTRSEPPRVVRLAVTPSGATAFRISAIPPQFAISPDGTRLAYVGAGAEQIVVRAFDQLEPTALSGLGAPGGLFFSPDGRWIGFFDGTGALKKVVSTGGPPVTVGRAIGTPRGASWSTDDTIVFATDNTTSGLLRVAAGGGAPQVLTTPNLDQGEQDHYWPEVLPGGQAVLFTILTAGGLSNAQIAVLDLTTREQKILIRGGSHARYVPTGHLVYGVAGTLRAVAFDLRRLAVVGTPVPVLEQVMTTATLGAVSMSISDNGTLVYLPGGVETARFTLAWVDRQGREDPLKAPPRLYLYPRLSPDGTRVALDTRDQESDIWIWDLARETMTRFTFDPGADTHPVWTPDGQRVVFRSLRAGPGNLFWQAVDGTGAVERLTESPTNQMASAVSPDGTQLVFREEHATTGEDLMVLALEGGRRAQSPLRGVGLPRPRATSDVRPLLQTTFNELNGEISPDGRWVAYQSNESGPDEIYVRPFPDANSGHWQVSTGGGTRPLWARSGKELFYLGPSGAVMSTSVDGGSTFRAGNPTRLFEGPYPLFANASGRTYDVSPDGQRFLMIKEGAKPDGTSAPTSLMVVLNWFEELKARVPPAK
jgi:protein kinase-like protein/WD40 repeat protein